MGDAAKHRTYMSVCSEKTLQSNEKGFFLQFADAVVNSAGEKWITKVFGKLKTDAERIRIVYHDPAVKDVVLNTLSHVQEIYRKKSAEVSQSRRFDAEKAFKSGDAPKALMLFSQSVLRAPQTGSNPRIDNGISLALALWSRSEILMHLKTYSLALIDIQQAMKEGLHNTHKAEAFWRMAICYKAQGEDKRAKVSMELAEKLLIKDSKKVELLKESMKRQYQEEKRVSRRFMPQVADPHPNFPHATSKMVLQADARKGRYAVATREIATGETIACEPPYTACLLPDCFGTHCHHCFEKLEAPFGCPDCCSIAFCSVECRDIASKTYHKHECKFLDLLIGSGMSILSHTALRMVTQNTPERMFDINKNRSLELVYSLCTLSEKRTPEDFLQRTLMAAFLLRCLQKSGYFGYVDDGVIPNENQLGIGGLLLFHLQMLQFNAHEIYETRHIESHRFRESAAKYIGVAVYPTVSMFNHSCITGVSRHFVGKNIVITSAHPLKAGDMIPENYGPIFSRKPFAERQRYLSGRYWFKCECMACIQGWPTFDSGLGNLNRRVRCPTTSCTNLFTLPMSNENVICPRCKNKVCLTENILQLQRCEDQYAVGFECMDNERVHKGIIILCVAIDEFYRVSAPPHKDTHLAQECLRALLADSGNVYEIKVAPKKK